MESSAITLANSPLVVALAIPNPRLGTELHDVISTVKNADEAQFINRRRILNNLLSQSKLREVTAPCEVP
jgi:hypothetical protein